MKHLLISCFYGSIYLMAVQDQPINGLILALLIISPFLITFIIERIDGQFNKKDFDDRSKYIVGVALNLAVIVFFVVIMSATLVYKSIDETSSKYLLFYSLYYSVFIFSFLIINYYATRSISLRKNIMTFIEAISNFFKEKFLISILAIFFSVVLKPVSKDLFLGIVGSYVFFFLSEIDSFYKKNKVSEKEYRKYDIVFQVIINILLILVLGDFEKLYNYIIYTKELPHTYWMQIPLHIALFTLSILISHFIELIIRFCKYILKFIMTRLPKAKR